MVAGTTLRGLVPFVGRALRFSYRPKSFSRRSLIVFNGFVRSMRKVANFLSDDLISYRSWCGDDCLQY